jgi:hypothetical protein
MAGFKRITDFTNTPDITDEDVFYIVRPSGLTPEAKDRKITWSDLKDDMVQISQVQTVDTGEKTFSNPQTSILGMFLGVLMSTIKWTERQTLDGNVYSLIYGNGLFVAGTEDDSVWTSSDGITWVERQTLDGSVYSLTYGNGLFVAGTEDDSVWTPGVA